MCLEVLEHREKIDGLVRKRVKTDRVLSRPGGNRRNYSYLIPSPFTSVMDVSLMSEKTISLVLTFLGPSDDSRDVFL